MADVSFTLSEQRHRLRFEMRNSSSFANPHRTKHAACLLTDFTLECDETEYEAG